MSRGIDRQLQVAIGLQHQEKDVGAQTLTKPRTAESTLSISRFNDIRNRLGLDTGTLLKMLKASLPPSIAIAIGHNCDSRIPKSTYHNCFSMPSTTSEVYKIMVFNLLATCVSASICCLAIFCSVKAGQHTLPPGGNVHDYSNSACAVSKLSLIFAI
ncbi:hypothetical protein AOQ84DRAFT_355239 [Glonium stellatum]|uniref:Uncharacterized protein n=1 Tax=Glonium stellatum TaxID=574774 RepID=A0A8E2EYK8_9PEZI|nr:hypothetical protein AOQ84DRAFT_355239 [Glonium stellatum]